MCRGALCLGRVLWHLVECSWWIMLLAIRCLCVIDDLRRGALSVECVYVLNASVVSCEGVCGGLGVVVWVGRLLVVGVLAGGMVVRLYVMVSVG